MQEILDAAIAVIRPTVAARAQTFEIARPSGPILMHADAARLRQIVANLLDNACKYTPREGGVSLRVVVDAARVTIEVRDSGIGLDPAVLRDIFKPFMQEQRAVAFNGHGLGIGLSLVQELVQAHGGEVSAQSAGVGRGSVFVVQLPRGLSTQGTDNDVDAADVRLN